MEGRGVTMNLTALVIMVVLLGCVVDSVLVNEKTFNVNGERFLDYDSNFDHRDHQTIDPQVHSHCVLNSSFVRQCGTRPLINTKHYDAEESAFGEFPHHVAILHGSGKKFLCSGALLDELHVITAARCVDDLPLNEIRLRLGEWDILNDKNLQEVYHSVERTCAKIFIHPKYLPKELYGNYDYDVAILRMNEQINFGLVPNVAPICLPEPEIYDPLNLDGSSRGGKMECYVAGWSESPVFMLQADYNGQVVVTNVYDGFKKRSSGSQSQTLADSLNSKFSSGSDMVSSTEEGKGESFRKTKTNPQTKKAAPEKVSEYFEDNKDYENAENDYEELVTEDADDLNDNFAQTIANKISNQESAERDANTNSSGIESKSTLRASASLSSILKRKMQSKEAKLRKRSPASRPNLKAFIESRYATEYSRILNKARVNVLDGIECTRARTVESKYVEYGLCLSAKKNDVCKADVGSPVVCFKKEKMPKRGKHASILESPELDVRSSQSYENKSPIKRFVLVGIVSDTSLCSANTFHKQRAISAISLNGVIDFVCDVISLPYY